MTFAEESTPRYVYGAYGSNMDPTRFDKYIAGADGGEHGAHAGSSDKTPTIVIGVRTIGAQLYFAGQSKRWGAATAYLSFVEPEAKSYLQTYSVSEQQMVDLARQEAGVSSGTIVSIPPRGESLGTAKDDLTADAFLEWEKGKFQISRKKYRVRWYGWSESNRHSKGTGF